MEGTHVDRQQKDHEVKMRITERLVQSGKKEELKELLRLRLVERGWRDEMKHQCKEVIREKGIDHVTVEDLVEEILRNGRALVPGDVKAAMLEQIKTFIKNEVEPKTSERQF